MKKRLLSVLLLVCMVLTLLPTAALAEDVQEENHAHVPVCTCETACTAESMNASCPVCGAEGASAENCAKYVKPDVQTQPEGEPVMLNDGVTEVSTAEELENALSGSANIKLMNDITMNGVLDIDRSVMLDLNNCKLNAEYIRIGYNASSNVEFAAKGGTIDVQVNNTAAGIIRDGTFSGIVSNQNLISGGTFRGKVANCNYVSFGQINFTEARITGGDFYGEVTNGPVNEGNGSGTIIGGSFYGKVTNTGFSMITGGDFYDEVVSNAQRYLWEGIPYGCITGGTFYGGLTDNSTGDTVQTWTVTYMSSDSVYARQVVRSGSTLTAPKAPTKTNRTFIEWRKGDTAWDFETRVTSDITLTAAWDTSLLPGSGTSEDPYRISTADHLKRFRDAVNSGEYGAHAVLDNDIDLGSEAWTPIMPNAISTEDTVFGYCGIFDGGGHTVSGLAVSSDQEYVGLFGYTSDATIRNLTVSGSVTGTNGSAKVGGIVGYAYRSTVENCGNLCTVSGKYAAGIVGHAYNTTISACYNAGEIIGGNDAGGLVGWFKGSTGKFYDCYNVGSVRGVSGYAGGIVGNAGVCMAYNCYNAGAVIGGEAYSIGYGTDVENSYYLKGTPKDYNDRTEVKSAEDFADGTVLEKLKIRTDSGDYPLPSDPWADRCQYVDAAGKTLPVFKWQGATHTHSSGGWQSDEADHWKKCDVCNAVFDKAAHSGGTATCKEKAKCAVCGQPYGELGAHSWGEVAYYWVETTTPYDFTCTAKRVCQNDENHVETETVDATYDVVREPTCLVEGQRYYTASFKNDWAVGGSELDVTIPALDHDWGEWTSNGDGTHTRVCKRDDTHTETVNCSGGTATCTEKATCTDCGGKYGEKDPDNHTGKKEWTITKTKHEQKWSCCGEITVAKESHSFGKWVVTKKATSKQEGEKTRTCEVCDYVEKATIPATGAPAKTGDESRIGMWAGILCVSLAGIIALAILYGKKHKK
ncbi:MAG TPA: hypothetical protein DDY81_02370 [Clostridiales bacterium]|nr:hypothetical protein [Clostridiales bacterium]